MWLDVADRNFSDLQILTVRDHRILAIYPQRKNEANIQLSAFFEHWLWSWLNHLLCGFFNQAYIRLFGGSQCRSLQTPYSLHLEMIALGSAKIEREGNSIKVFIVYLRPLKVSLWRWLSLCTLSYHHGISLEKCIAFILRKHFTVLYCISSTHNCSAMLCSSLLCSDMFFSALLYPALLCYAPLQSTLLHSKPP